MSRKISKVLLIGSTGTIGTHITSAFASLSVSGKSPLEKVAIFTSPSTVESKKAFIDELKSKNIEVIVGDLGDDDQVKKAFEGFDTVISALGRGALHLQSRLVDIFASLPKLPSGHSRRFYPSEYGTDIKYDPVTSPHEKPHQNKLATRAHIETLAKEGKIEFTYIVTGPFADTFIYARAQGRAGYDRTRGTYGIVGPSDPSQQPRISGTTYADTGRFVLSSVLTPDASANATLRVSSFDAKPAELKGALEKLEGKSFDTTYTPLDEFKQLEEKAWADNDPAATVYTLTRIWYEGGSDFTKKPRAVYVEGDKEEENKGLEEQLFKDVPRRSLEDVLKTLL